MIISKKLTYIKAFVFVRKYSHNFHETKYTTNSYQQTSLELNKNT